MVYLRKIDTFKKAKASDGGFTFYGRQFNHNFVRLVDIKELCSSSFSAYLTLMI
ncbi:hypothetical protein UF75_1787 [Desulfosporosinus sp. I2]|nr:hypothetical protein UF75_1787 [Desulfosporosinus sp. I2]